MFPTHIKGLILSLLLQQKKLSINHIYQMITEHYIGLLDLQ